MQISTLFQKERPVFSLEVFPPKKSSGILKIYDTLHALSEIEPDFISVTYGAGGGEAGQQTADLAAHIKKDLHIEPLAHMTCVQATESDIQKNLQVLEDNQIENILALRGDLMEDAPLHPDFLHASDLAKYISAHSTMNLVGACYPEGHFETKNIEQDIENLKYKLDAGVKHLITQLFFDNSKFYDFLNLVRSKNINVPIEAGIMPIVTTRQIERTVALSGASLPVDFTHMVSRYSQNPEALFHAGTAYAIEQICELLEFGVDGIHLYTMNNARVAKEVYQGVKERLGR